jgi:hypothetical protein
MVFYLRTLLSFFSPLTARFTLPTPASEPPTALAPALALTHARSATTMAIDTAQLNGE